MKKMSTEVKVGLVCIASIAVLVLGLNFLKGQKLFDKPVTYNCITSDLNGVLPKNGVFINGMKVGTVSKISHIDPSLKTFLLKLEIESGVKLPVNSTAEAFSRDILGSKAVQIAIGDSKEYAKKGDTLIWKPSESMFGGIQEKIDPIMIRAGNILENTDSITLALKNVLNQKAQEDLIAAISDLSTTMNYLAKEKENIESILTNAKLLMESLNENSEKLSYALANFSNISDTIVNANIGGTLTELNATLQSVSTSMKKIEKGEGNLGLLLNQDSLYYNLESASRNLDLLLEDIKANPKRYVKISVF
ncbi:MlaD family protein [Bacteroidales bacterium OttesenSCG-928-C19]|nr:MlaD family protein [Bacteroidales bacterium OttesenSCG-928-C19]